MGVTREVMEMIKKAESTLPHTMAMLEHAIGSEPHLKWMFSYVCQEMNGRADPQLIRLMINSEYRP